MACIKKVFKSVAIITIIGVITRLLSFVFKILLSRMLGAEKLGVLQIALSFIGTLLCFSCSGIPSTISRIIAEKDTGSKKPSPLVCGVLSSGLYITLAISATVVTVTLLMRNHLDIFLKNGNSIPIFLILLPSVFTSSIYCSIRAFLWGRNDYKAFSLTEMLEEVLRIIFAVAIIYIGIMNTQKEKAVALAFTVADCICCICLLVVFFAKGGKFTKPRETKRLLKNSTPITLSRFSASIISSFIAFMLPMMLVSAGNTMSEATAHFGRAVGMAHPILMSPMTIIGSITTVLVPMIAKSNVKGDISDIRSKISTSLTISAVTASLFSVVFFVAGKELGQLLFNDIESGKYIVFAQMMITPMCLYSVSGTVLNSLGKEYIALRNFLISSIFLILSVLFLPKVAGVYSLAIGYTITYSVAFFLNLISLRKTKAVDEVFISKLTALNIISFATSTLAFGVNKILCRFINPLISVIPCVILALIAQILLFFAFNIVDYKLIFKRKNRKNKKSEVVLLSAPKVTR